MLADAAGFEPNIPMMQLLDSVTYFLKEEAQRPASDDISKLRSLNENLMRQIISCEERLQCEGTEAFDLTPSNSQEVPVRTHSNDVLRKMIKLERPCSNVYPTPSPEPLPKQSVTPNTYLTLDSVLDDVISLEEDKMKKESFKPEIPDYQWSPSDVLDGVISLEDERTPVPQVLNYNQWSADDFQLELL